MVRVDTRGTWLDAFLSVATCVAFMTITAYVTAWWIRFSQVHVPVDWNSAGLFALQLPQVVIAAGSYVLSTRALAKRWLPWGIRDGVGVFGFLTSLTLLLILLSGM